MYITTFTVVGLGYFPVDMLRYDSCFPSGSKDASEIGASQPFAIDETTRKRPAVELTRFHKERHWKPTEARWRSFGWRVESVSIARRIL